MTEEDCGTTNGVAMKALVEGGEVIEALRERILGRVGATDIINPENARTCCTKPARCWMKTRSKKSKRLGIDEVKVRTPLTCETRYGSVRKCYGRDLGRGSLVNVGEAVGVIAAQSIGEPGTQLTMRTFHIGGAASRAAVASVGRSKSNGTVRFHRDMRYVTNAQGRADRDFASRRSADHRRSRPRARASQGAVRRDAAVERRRAGQGRARAGDVGSAYPSDHHRIRRYGALRERRRRRDRRQADRRGHRAVDAGRDRSQAARHRAGQGLASAGQAARRSGQEVKIAGSEHSVKIRLPDRLH